MAGGFERKDLLTNSCYFSRMTRVNPEEYLEALEKSDLLRCIQMNQKNAKAWIAYARHVKRAGELNTARLVIEEGCMACPANEDVWVETVDLELLPHEKKRVLRMGLKIVPDSVVLWEALLNLSGDSDSLNVLREAILSCPQHLEFWLSLAEKEPFYVDARDVLARAAMHFPSEEVVWLAAAMLVKKYDTRNALIDFLVYAVEKCPGAKDLWLLGAREMLIAGNPYGRHKFLEQAYLIFPDSLDILLELAEEVVRRDSFLARDLFCRARLKVGTNTPDSARVWMKSAICERTLKNPVDEKKLLTEGIKHFPSFFKFWLMLGQLEERFARFEDARETYQKGLHSCPNCIRLWISLAKVVEKIDGFLHAQDIYSHGREVNPCSPELWVAEIGTCLENGRKNKACLLMAKAVQECPTSGILWATYIYMVSDDEVELVYRKALSMSNNDANVIAAVAGFLRQSKKFRVAREWFEWAVKTDPDNGDVWGLYYRNESSMYRSLVEQRCLVANPKHGRIWAANSKTLLSGQALMFTAVHCATRIRLCKEGE